MAGETMIVEGEKESEKRKRRKKRNGMWRLDREDWRLILGASGRGGGNVVGKEREGG